MANGIADGLKRAVILKSAMEAFKATLLPLNLFSTSFKNVALEGDNTVEVPYFPLATSASKDFNGTYLFDSGDINSKTITINKRKYQSLTYTSEEKARQPVFDPVILGRMKGAKLAEDVLKNILSVVTNANFGSAIFTGSASTFDGDELIDIQTALDGLDWPDTQRGLVLKNTYLGSIRKDLKNAGGIGAFGTSGFDMLPSLAGFNIVGSNIIPDNGENLVGFAVNPSAILVAFAPIKPTDSVMKNLSAYETYEDVETGLTMEYRAWGDPDADSSKEVIECNYGFAVGEGAGLKRIVSA